MKNVRGKSHLQQWKISSKTTKGKQQLKQLPANSKFLTAMTQANPKLPTAMMQANPKFIMGRSMLTVVTLNLGGKSCVELHNYYINNFNKDQDIIVSYKEQHFLVGDGIFFISWFNLYDLFNLDALDISLMRCFTL
jgi:hypothetical protein